MKHLKDTYKKIKSQASHYLQSRLILFFLLSFGVLILISCTYTYTPDWQFTFDEPEQENNSEKITLIWDANTEPDLEGYKLYYGYASREYSYSIDVGNLTSYTVADLEAGETYYFTVTAYNASGYESDYSDEVNYEVPLEG